MLEKFDEEFEKVIENLLNSVNGFDCLKINYFEVQYMISINKINLKYKSISRHFTGGAHTHPVPRAPMHGTPLVPSQARYQLLLSNHHHVQRRVSSSCCAVFMSVRSEFHITLHSLQKFFQLT